jgi:hypothetical protein
MAAAAGSSDGRLALLPAITSTEEALGGDVVVKLLAFFSA